MRVSLCLFVPFRLVCCFAFDDRVQDFQNGLEFSLPFLMDHMTRLIVGLLKVVRGAEAGDEEAQRLLDLQIRKLEKWNRLSHSVRTEREALFQELRYLSESGSDEELFRRALEVVSLVFAAALFCLC